MVSLAVFRQIENLEPQAMLAPRFLPLAQGRPFDLQQQSLTMKKKTTRNMTTWRRLHECSCSGCCLLPFFLWLLYYREGPK